VPESAPEPEVPEDEMQVDSDMFPVERYKPLEKIGSGSTGQVYLCRDRLLRKKVAVKTLRQVTPEQLVAFQMEARATSQLNHPNIVTILDFGATASGAPFMVLEFVKGESLDIILNREKLLPWKLALDLAVQLADALTHAHSLGIYHRDLKPSNIILTMDENGVRLIDFGVAKLQQAQEPTIVQGRTLVGTPAYMSPDQMLGHDFDARSEIYTLGCVIFQCITGAVPFVGATSLETLTMHAQDEPPALSEFNLVEPVSIEVQQLVDKCMSKSPDDRFQTMAELATRINALLERNESDSGSSTDRSDRNAKAYLGLVAAACLALCVFVFSTSSLKKQEQPAANRAVKKSKFKEEAGLVERIPNMVWTTPTEPITDEDLKDLPDDNDVKNLFLVRQEKVSGSGFKHLKPTLTALSAEYTGVTDENLGYLNNQKHLEWLSLSSTKVTKAGLAKLTDLPNLRVLNLVYCTGIDDDAVKLIVKRWPNLERLQIGDTKCTGAALQEVAKLDRMLDLEVGSIIATQEQWAQIFAMPSVRELNVATSNVGSASVPAICKMTQMRRLTLEGCSNLTQKDLVTIEKSLPRCRVSGSSTTPTTVKDEYDRLDDMFGKLGE